MAGSSLKMVNNTTPLYKKDGAWAQCTTMQLKNDMFAPCFSSACYHKAVSKGAMKAGLTMMERNNANTKQGWARIRARFGINIEEERKEAATAMRDLQHAHTALSRAADGLRGE